MTAYLVRKVGRHRRERFRRRMIEGITCLLVDDRALSVKSENLEGAKNEQGSVQLRDRHREDSFGLTIRRRWKDIETGSALERRKGGRVFADLRRIPKKRSEARE